MENEEEQMGNEEKTDGADKKVEEAKMAFRAGPSKLPGEDPNVRTSVPSGKGKGNGNKSQHGHHIGAKVGGFGFIGR